MNDLQNPQPKIFAEKQTIALDDQIERRRINHILKYQQESDSNHVDEFDKYEVFELLRYIRDPEHPLTLEQLNIIQIDDIVVDNSRNQIDVIFTPTIPHCSLAQTIGLTMRVKLARCLPKRFKVQVLVKPGTHSQVEQINKQISDKERIQAAMENQALINIVNVGLKDSDRFD